jgi:hypothetical protein
MRAHPMPDLFSPTVALGDGLDGLRSMRSGSVGLVLSDLPSGQTRAATDLAPRLEEFWPEAWRVLRPDGSAVLMASSFAFAARLVASQPKAFRYDLIWHKTLGGGFLNAKKRPLRAHEFVLVFSRTLGTYHPQMRVGLRPVNPNAGRRSSGENYGAAGGGQSRAGATDRYPWSVLSFPSLGTTDKRRVHHQQKPVELLRWCVRSYSEPGELVVDPYAGSGSTGAAAAAEGRSFFWVGHRPPFRTKTPGVGITNMRATCKNEHLRPPEGNRPGAVELGCAVHTTWVQFISDAARGARHGG